MCHNQSDDNWSAENSSGVLASSENTNNKETTSYMGLLLTCLLLLHVKKGKKERKETEVTYAISGERLQLTAPEVEITESGLSAIAFKIVPKR